MKRYDVKTAEDLVFIPCHLNTHQKIERTKELINHYSKDHFVLIGSHYAIPEEVSSLADFSFYDKNNPMVGVHEHCRNGKIFSWVKIGDRTLTKVIPNHGYAHMLLLKTAYYLSLGWQFKRFHHINYDIPLDFFNLTKLKEHNNILEKYFAVCYNWFDHGNLFTDRFDANIFSFNLNQKISAFLNMNTYADWDDQKFGFSTEQFLHLVFKNFKTKVFQEEMRIDEFDSVDTIDKEKVSYAHPYASNLIQPVIVFDDGVTYQIYLENKSLDASHNVLLKLNGEEVLNIDILPRMYLTRSVCPNHEKNGILQFYVNNELKNTFIISETYNLGVWTE